MDVITLIAVLANILTAGRLIFYRRNNSRFRRPMSVAAYLLIFCSGGRAIDALANGSIITIWEASFAVVISFLVWRARGNVAAIMRCDHARIH